MKKGLGDLIEAGAKLTGVKQLVDSKAETEECTPCAKRKKALNERVNINVPYKIYA